MNISGKVVAEISNNTAGELYLCQYRDGDGSHWDLVTTTFRVGSIYSIIDSNRRGYDKIVHLDKNKLDVHKLAKIIATQMPSAGKEILKTPKFRVTQMPTKYEILFGPYNSSISDFYTTLEKSLTSKTNTKFKSTITLLKRQYKLLSIHQQALSEEQKTLPVYVPSNVDGTCEGFYLRTASDEQFYRIIGIKNKKFITEKDSPNNYPLHRYRNVLALSKEVLTTLSKEDIVLLNKHFKELQTIKHPIFSYVSGKIFVAPSISVTKADAKIILSAIKPYLELDKKLRQIAPEKVVVKQNNKTIATVNAS